MLKKQAIILCAFANDLHRPLQLEEEEKTIAQTFTSAEDAGKISFRPLHGAQLDDIYQNFNRFHNRVHIFHFSTETLSFTWMSQFSAVAQSRSLVFY